MLLLPTSGQHNILRRSLTRNDTTGRKACSSRHTYMLKWVMPLRMSYIVEWGEKKRARHRRLECVEPECVRIPSVQFDSSRLLRLATLDWAKLKMESSRDHQQCHCNLPDASDPNSRVFVVVVLYPASCVFHMSQGNKRRHASRRYLILAIPG